MADVRVNGRRFPILQAIDNVGTLIDKLEALAAKENQALTALSINNSPIDIDNAEFRKMKLGPSDTVDALLETPEQLALQSLQVAQEMAELLIFDLKVATLCLWEGTRSQRKSLETLLNDCSLFLNLGAKPIDLLGKNPNNVPVPVENCLRQLDIIANNVEDAILLASHNHTKDSAHVLVARVLPAIEKWLELSYDFAQELSLAEPTQNTPLSASEAFTPTQHQVSPNLPTPPGKIIHHLYRT